MAVLLAWQALRGLVPPTPDVLTLRAVAARVSVADDAAVCVVRSGIGRWLERLSFGLAVLVVGLGAVLWLAGPRAKAKQYQAGVAAARRFNSD